MKSKTESLDYFFTESVASQPDQPDESVSQSLGSFGQSVSQLAVQSINQ